ncbi:hypothetical protein D3C78_1568000 [compost metagenome]
MAAIVAGAHLEAFLAEPGGQQVGELVVVVDQQQFTHRFLGALTQGRWARRLAVRPVGQGRVWRNGLTTTSA